jgi:hypothetical protein
MSSKLLRVVLCFLVSSVAATSVGLAAEVTPQVYVDFVGKLEGKAYKLGSRELDKTKTFAAHHGTEIVAEGLGALTDADQASQESFEFDASAFNNNATVFTGTPFVVEAVFTPAGTSDSMAPIIDIGGQAFIRFQSGLSAGSWNGSTDNVNNNIRTIPVAGETHHYAIVYDGINTIDYYLDGAVIFQSTNGSPQQITKWVSWGNIRHSSVNGGRQLLGQYDAVAFSTFTGAFDPTKDFILPKGLGSAGAAYEPQPAHEAVDVPADVTLSWTPGVYAATHDVYIGTSFADVNDASRADPEGVLAAQDLSDVGYAGADLFEYGTVYYWRVDEVNAAPDNTIYKGEVWSFTAEPFSYPIKNVTATASSTGRADTVAQNTVNGSGLNADDQHSVDAKDMWLSGNAKPHWIQYQFDQVYKLHELWVWNSNQVVEAFVGFGAKNVAIEYSVDGTTWATLEGVPQFARGTGEATYRANTFVGFGGVSAQFVKLTINSNWGGVAQQTSLSEVRFFYVPLKARGPQPADAATGVGLDVPITWRPGREATSHQVFFGTDSAAVAAGTVAGATVTEHSYTPAPMTFGTKYFWKVNEIGDAGAYEGDLWSFTSLEFAPIDDFDGYTDDEGSRIYQAWIDGVTDPANGGSTVGYMQAPFAERAIIHGGRQSMPLAYDNTKPPFFSETSRQFASAQDWTVSGATDLCVWTRSSAAPTGATPMYLTVTDSAGKTATVTSDTAATVADWTRWTIPMNSLSGASLAKAKKLTIGVGTRGGSTAGGSGMVFIDDIGFGQSAQ